MGPSEFYKQFVTKMKTNVEGINFATAKLQADMLEAYKNKGNKMTSQAYLTYSQSIKSHCNDQVYALIFMQQAGDQCKECQRDLKKKLYKGNNHIPTTVDEAFDSYHLHVLTAINPTRTAIIR